MDFGCAFSNSRDSIDIVPIAMHMCVPWHAFRSSYFHLQKCSACHGFIWFRFSAAAFFLFLFFVCFFVCVSGVRSVSVCVPARVFLHGRACASMMTCLGGHVDVRAFLSSVCVRTSVSVRLCLCACRRSSSRYCLCDMWSGDVRVLDR